MARRTRLSDRILLELVESAYAAAEDVALWQVFLSRLSDVLGATGALLMHHDLVRDGGVAAAVRIDPDAVRVYNEHFHAVDPWATAQRAHVLANVGTAVHEEQILPHTAFTKTEFFNDFSRRYGTSRLVTAPLLKNSEAVTVLSAYRAERDEPFDAAATTFVAALAPHVQRSIAIHHQLSISSQARGAALQALDAARCAVMLVAGDAVVIEANRTGARLLRADGPLSTVDGVLTAATPAATARLRGLIADAATLSDVRRPTGGGMVIHGRDDARLHVLVAPVRPHSELRLPSPDIAAVVFVRDPDQLTPVNQRWLMELFGLTATEAKIAARLASGDSLEEIAGEYRYSKQTLQWYSKQLLQKTGSRNRADLVRRLATSLASVDQEA